MFNRYEIAIKKTGNNRISVSLRTLFYKQLVKTKHSSIVTFHDVNDGHTQL